MLTHQSRIRTGHKSLLLCVLAAAAFAGNLFAPRLANGADYYFGSIALLISVQFCGRWPGLLAGMAATAGAFLAASQIYTPLLFLLEAVWLVWLLPSSRNGNAIIWDALFWAVIGAPLIVLLTDPQAAGQASVNTLVFWVNGITNAMVAGLLLMNSRLRAVLSADSRLPALPIRQLIFNQMMTIALLPAVVVLVPAGPFRNILAQGSGELLAGLLAIELLAMAAAMYTARRLARPLDELTGITTGLPERLLQGKAPPLPESGIEEIDNLGNNFRVMATALGYKFQEISYYGEAMETRVAERTRELTKANRELKREIAERVSAEKERDRLLKELRQKNEELEGIVYVASHDLRSPLVNVQGFSRKLSDSCEELKRLTASLETGPQQQRLHQILEVNIPKSLGFITSSTEKMGTLLNGLLRLSRLGQAAFCLDRLDMNALLDSITASMAYQIEHANASVSRDDLLPCMADAGQVAQVFSNLLDNALKYRCPERPLLVHISCRETDNGVAYCVEDNGIGIAANHLDRIWEIFHRLNPAQTQGDGLGLTLARQIINRLGGTIRVESEPGAGSRFFVELPRPYPAK